MLDIGSHGAWVRDRAVPARRSARHTRFVPAAPVRVCAVQYQLRRLSSFDEFAERAR